MHEETEVEVIETPEHARFYGPAVERLFNERRMSVEWAIVQRKSIREYSDARLSGDQIDRILVAARKYPSAGKRRPLDIVAVTDDERKRALARAANQEFVAKAPVVFVILADYGRTTEKYPGRGERYVHMEAGHAAQNILLVATEMGLGACPVGAFKDFRVARILNTTWAPLYLIPVGRPK